MKHLIALGCALLVACSSTPTTQVAAAHDARCSRETPTGTNLPTIKCRTAEQLEQERRAVEATRDSIRPMPAATKD